MVAEVLYYLRNIDGAFFVYGKKSDLHPQHLSLGDADASGDLEKKLNGLIPQNEGGYLVYVPTSEMEEFLRQQLNDVDDGK